MIQVFVQILSTKLRITSVSTTTIGLVPSKFLQLFSMLTSKLTCWEKLGKLERKKKQSQKIFKIKRK